MILSLVQLSKVSSKEVSLMAPSESELSIELTVVHARSVVLTVLKIFCTTCRTESVVLRRLQFSAEIAEMQPQLVQSSSRSTPILQHR